MTTNSHGQRYCVGLAAPVQKDAPELLGSFERFWRTSKTSPMERECTSAICLAISLLRYQSREETTGLYSACLPHWGWAEAGIILPVTLGVQMEVSYCSSPVSLSVVTRAGLTRPPYAHDSKWTMLTSPALESKAIMTSLGGLDGVRRQGGGRSYGVSCSRVTPCKVRWERVRLVLSEGLRSCFKILPAGQWTPHVRYLIPLCSHALGSWGSFHSQLPSGPTPTYYRSWH